MSNKNIMEQINNNINDNIFNSYLGNQQAPIKHEEIKAKDIIKSDALITKDNYKYKDKTPNKDGQLSKAKNYTITFKIDADIEQYLKNIDLITFIESVKKGTPNSKDATSYVNDLIRQDMLKVLGVSNKENDPNKWINALNDYIKNNHIPNNR